MILLLLSLRFDFTRPMAIRFLAVACLLFVPFCNVHAGSRDPLLVQLPDLPVIPGASWSWVGARMAINGVPMSIKTFEFLGSEQQIVRYYTNLWKLKGHGQSVAKDFGSKRIIGYELDGFYSSVQYRQEGPFVKGKLVVTKLQLRAGSSKKSRIPKPPSSKRISRVESLDGGQRTETVTFESNKTVDFNMRYYENQYDNDGWKLAYAKVGEGNAVIRHYQRNGELMQITITQLSGDGRRRSHILVHWIK